MQNVVRACSRSAASSERIVGHSPSTSLTDGASRLTTRPCTAWPIEPPDNLKNLSMVKCQPGRFPLNQRDQKPEVLKAVRCEDTRHCATSAVSAAKTRPSRSG